MMLTKKLSKDKSLKVNVAISRKKTFTKKYIHQKYVSKKVWKQLIASYDARVRGSVFKMDLRVLSREFESIETSPGFAQLLV